MTLDDLSNPLEPKRRAAGESFKRGSQEDLCNRFLYHKPTGRHVAVHEALRAVFFHFVRSVSDALPDSREKSMALTKLEEASFWAQAAVARVEIPGDTPDAQA